MHRPNPSTSSSSSRYHVQPSTSSIVHRTQPSQSSTTPHHHHRPHPSQSSTRTHSTHPSTSSTQTTNTHFPTTSLSLPPSNNNKPPCPNCHRPTTRNSSPSTPLCSFCELQIHGSAYLCPSQGCGCYKQPWDEKCGNCLGVGGSVGLRRGKGFGNGIGDARDGNGIGNGGLRMCGCGRRFVLDRDGEGNGGGGGSIEGLCQVCSSEEKGWREVLGVLPGLGIDITNIERGLSAKHVLELEQRGEVWVSVIKKGVVAYALDGNGERRGVVGAYRMGLWFREGGRVL